MADLKISDLDPDAQAVAGDQLIINKGDATTKKIDIADFVASLIGGGGGNGEDGLTDLAISPSFFTFGVSYSGNPADFERITGVDSIFEPQPTRTITMPPGANAAMVVNSYGCGITASPLIGAGQETNAMAQFQYQVSLTNATWRFAPDPALVTMSMGSAHHMPGLYNYGIADSYASKCDNSRPNVIDFAEGATVTFTLKAGIRRGKKCIPGMGGGRMIVFPYNTSNEIQRSAIEGVMSALSDDDMVAYTAAGVDPDIFAPLTEEEIERNNSQDLKHSINHVISAITQTLEYDEEFDAKFPLDTIVNDPSGAPAAAPRTVLANIRKALFNLKNKTSGNVEEYFTDYNTLVFGNESANAPGAAGYVGFTYGFERAVPSGRFASF